MGAGRLPARGESHQQVCLLLLSLCNMLVVCSPYVCTASSQLLRNSTGTDAAIWLVRHLIAVTY